ncbi:hypothetical protein IWQ56_007384, partial [Coemansia nantahalensis]
LNKLADMSKTALNMQDLGIYLGDGDGDTHAEKAGADPSRHATSDMSPATPRRAGDAPAVFATPIDGPLGEDPDEAHGAGGAGASSDGEEGEEGEECEESEGGGPSTRLSAAIEEEGEVGECGRDREDEEGELLG